MFTPIETGDGSSTFYSEAFGEWFHSRAGARSEAQKTYVATARLGERAGAGQLRILDVCYGLGYNTAAALEAVWQESEDSDRDGNTTCEIEVVALELDVNVPKSAIACGLTQQYSLGVQRVLQDLAAKGTAKRKSLSATLELGDARQTIQPLVAKGWRADVIFLDPFSPPHCPQLWTVEFLRAVAQCLNPRSGLLVTYSCAAAVRSALQLAGLTIGSIQAAGRKWPGTAASYAAIDLPPLSPQEQEHLQTRAAVPYRDPTLAATAEEILAQRASEQATSALLPTGPWRKRWKAIATAERAPI